MDYIFNSDRQAAFDSAYKAHLPHELRTFGPELSKFAPQYTDPATGHAFPIDREIMFWGWSPYSTTLARNSLGYTWVSAANQDLPPISPPGFHITGAQDYDPQHPIGVFISVPDANTCDLATTFPPYDTITPIPPLPEDAPNFSNPWTGNWDGATSGWFSKAIGNYKPTETVETIDGKDYRKIQIPNAFGMPWQVWVLK